MYSLFVERVCNKLTYYNKNNLRNKNNFFLLMNFVSNLYLQIAHYCERENMNLKKIFSSKIPLEYFSFLLFLRTNK